MNYVNDPQGRRIGRIVNGVFDRGWIYGDALAPIAEIGPTGAISATYVYASRVNVPDLVVKSGVTYRLVFDHLGSVRAVVNTNSGAVVQRTDFDEWGNVIAKSGTSATHSFGFAGGLYDEFTGLIRFGSRDFDPLTARWVSKDPIHFESGSTNHYAYCGNDSINRIDVLGLWEAAAGGYAGFSLIPVTGAEIEGFNVQVGTNNATGLFSVDDVDHIGDGLMGGLTVSGNVAFGTEGAEWDGMFTNLNVGPVTFFWSTGAFDSGEGYFGIDVGLTEGIPVSLALYPSNYHREHPIDVLNQRTREWLTIPSSPYLHTAGSGQSTSSGSKLQKKGC